MKVKNIHIKYILLAYLGLFAYGLIDNSRGPIYPQLLIDYNLSPFLGSHFFSICSLAGLLVTIASKTWLSFGLEKSLRFFLFSQAIGCFGMGYSKSYTMVLASAFLYGLGVGGVSIACNLMISYGVSDNLRRKAYSGFHAMYGIASLLAPFLLSITLKSGHDWKNYLEIIAVIPLLIMFFSFNVTSLAPKIVRDKNHVKLDFKVVAQICLIFSFYVAGEISISSRLVYYMRFLNFTQENASLYLMFFFICLLGGRLTFSLFNFKMESYHLLLISSISSLVFYCMGLMIHPIFLSLCGLTMSIFFPCAMDRLCDKFKGYTESILPIIVSSIAIFNTLMHWGIGILSNTFSIRYALFSGPVFLLLSTYFLINNKISKK